MNEAMQKLVEAVQKASPVVWHAAYRQVWVDGAENALLSILFFCACIDFARWGERQRKEHDDWHAALFIAAFAFGLLTIPFTVCAIDCFANPTFQAIRVLKGLL